MSDEARATLSSIWTIRLALFCVALVSVTIVFHRIFGMATPVALNLFALAFIGSAFAILVGLFALVRIWKRGWSGGANAVTGIVISALLLAWPLSYLPTAQRLPMIYDVTTDPGDPPPLIAAARLRPQGANPVAYPGVEFSEKQNATYVDLTPLFVDRPAVETLEIVEQALQRMRMTIVGETSIGELGPGSGQIEAVDRTLVLGFYDDVAVRVTRVSGGSLVDVRSASRFGRSDLGRNADRIREVKAQIVERLLSTVPASSGRSLTRRQRSK
ncbi:MAG: DUF1499 domain-containing protein [Hyphomicrobiaceae bacterium]